MAVQVFESDGTVTKPIISTQADDLGSPHVVWVIPALSAGSLSATARTSGMNEIEDYLTVLASRWRRQTGGLSSPLQKADNLDYLKIVALGRLALPFILRELRDHGGQWYSALEAITRLNLIPPESAGYVARMKTAWLEWGRSEGLI